MAKQVFERAGLPNEILGQIWNLADRDARGQLNETEFVVAMHLLASMRSGSMRALPQSLPQGLYDAASRRTPQSPVTGSVPRQFSAQAPQRTQSPLARSFGSPPVSAQTTGNDWLITPREKAASDASFATLDRVGRGHITGDQAVAFFSNSGLPEDTLATIWDLADINSEGHLNRDEFAVAMYLIRQQRGMTTERGNLPTSLPSRLVPPSMRQRTTAPSQPTAPSFDNAAFASQQPQSAANDLFGLDALSSDAAPTQSPAQKADPFSGTEVAASPTSPPKIPPPPQSRAPASGFKPFIPSSSFGQGLATQHTGESVQSSQASSRAPPQQAAGSDDLLGDTDPDVSNKFNAETTELANMSNQIGTLHNQMREVQDKKSTHERDTATSSNQKRELEARLAEFRTQYEQEIRAVKSLEECLNMSRTETRKLGQDLAMVEGAHQDLKNQHQQLSIAFEADQKENAGLKEKIRQLNEEVAELRPSLEKLRSDARQQKGMTAINKKQLATNESERDRLSSEKSELEKEIQERPTSSTSRREAPSSGMASPAASAGGQSMNPFFRKSPPPSSDRSMSLSNFKQEYASPGPSAFESFFGPSDPAQQTAPPPTTFGNGVPQSTSSEVFDGSNTDTSPARSSSIPGLQTPPQSERVTSTEMPRAFEPPPPPESRQITSSALPFRGSHLRSESPTSSVQANPPASRSGMSDVGGTSARAFSSSASSTGGEDTPVMEHQHELGNSLQNNQSLPATNNGQPRRALDPRVDSTSYSRSRVPGAFPGDLESPAQSTPTGGSTASEKSRSDMRQDGTSPTAARQANFDSVFAPPGAAQGSSLPSIENDTGRGFPAAARAQSEFPSIQDVGPEESDSESERGFDNDFAGHTQSQHVRAEPTAGSQRVPDSGIERSDMATTRPPMQYADSSASVASQLPSSSAQKSPPTYESTRAETDGQGRGSNQFPPEFGGLLPSRETSAQSPEASQSPPASMRNAIPSLPPLTSPPVDTTSLPVSQELRGPVAAKAASQQPPDDFDFAFDDLDDAKEADDQGQEAFGFSNSSRPHDDDHDFNPIFDSPPTTRDTAGYDSIQHTPTTSRGNGTDVLRPSEPAPSTNNTFVPASNSPFAASSTADQAQQPQFANSSHDWDAIFSGLDKPVGSSAANGPIQSGKSPFALDEPSEQGAGTGAGLGAETSTATKVAAAAPSSFSKAGTSSYGPSAGTDGISQPTNTASPPPQATQPSVMQSPNHSTSQRPTGALARAISHGTEHDDPILKSLTSMGYPRDQALGALEKYDYNLDKVSSCLSLSLRAIDVRC